MGDVVADGVSKTVLRPGNGPHVKKGDQITVHCTGLLAATNAKFWSTKDPGQEPFTFKVGVGQVITGWDEGCLTMSKGEVARLTIAGHKGYGSKGFPAWGITPNAALIFEIEVLSINGR
jgi:FKBP-type peptidyl-prolyl cis-trans isomerase